MNKYYVFRSVVLMAIIGVIACIYACTGDVRQGVRSGKDDSAKTTLADDSGGILVPTVSGNTVVVKPHDDPENPYQADYMPWDIWAREHLLLEPFVRKDTKEQPANYLCLRIRIDDAGYVVPHHIGMHEMEQARIDDNLEEYLFTTTWVRAEGEIDPGLRQDMYSAGFAAQAEYYEPIPDWLVENLPFRAMLLPNGDVVTEGLLGDQESKRGCCGGSGGVYARYNSNGELLRALTTDSWWYLYYELDEFERPEGAMINTRDGYFKFIDKSTGRLLSVWDYDGTQLPTVEPPHRAPQPFTWLESKALKSYHDASQN